MKKTFLASGIILTVLLIECITYYSIASSRLPKRVINNLQIDRNYLSDTIIFGSSITIYGTGKETLTPYSLNLLSKENKKLLRNKLAPNMVWEETALSNFCNSQQAKNMSSLDCSNFVDNLKNRKTKLYITALEEQLFSVTVNTNLSSNGQFYYNEDHYTWILFFWLNL